MLSQDLVKVFLNHPDKIVRSFATEYFKDSHSQDTGLMRLVLDACELYPTEPDTRFMLNDASYFVQSEESLERIFNTLSKMSKRNELRLFYEPIIINSDINILKKFSDKFSFLESGSRGQIKQRMLISKKSTDSLLQELIEFSEKNNEKYINEFNHNYGNYIVWELASRKDLSKTYIMSIIEDIQVNAYNYFEGYIVTLAGELRLREAIPYLVEFLDSDGDLLPEEAMYALSKIGTEDVVDSIALKFPTASWHFRNFACGVLESIKLPRTEEILLDLLDKESDLGIKTSIAGGLCKLLSSAAIPKLQKMLPDDYDTFYFSLEEFLYINATMNGLDMPELQEWKKIAYDAKEYFRKKIPLFSGIQEKKVGRNDPCPCGSGLKYKKCCGKN